MSRPSLGRRLEKRLHHALWRLWRRSQRDRGERRAAKARARFWDEVREGQREAEAHSNGRGRFLAMPPGLGSLLIDLLAERRREGLQRGWPDVPEWVFPSKTGGPLDARNFERAWLRVRRRAAKRGVRPLKLHCTHRTWASLALASGKSVRWVADQLGHASPTLTRAAGSRIKPQLRAHLGTR